MTSTLTTEPRQVSAAGRDNTFSDGRWAALEAKVRMTSDKLRWANIRQASRSCLPTDDGGCGQDVIHEGLAVPLVSPLTGKKVSEQVWLGHLPDPQKPDKRHKPLSAAGGRIGETHATFGRLNGRNRALIVEGITDWLVASVAMTKHPDRPLWAVLGVPGTGSAKGLVGLLAAEGVEQIVLALDEDDSGRKATSAALEAWDEAECHTRQTFASVQGLAEGDDICDHFHKHGIAKVLELFTEDLRPVAKVPRRHLDRDDVLYELDRLGIGLRLNGRTAKYEFRNPRSPQELDHRWGDLTGEAEADIRRELNSVALWGAGRMLPAHWQEMKLQIGHHTRADPWREWLEQLPVWDTVPRVAGLFPTLWTLAPGEDVAICASEGAISLFWGAVQRTFAPGSEHDEVCTLISDGQGFGKTKFCGWLFPDHLSRECAKAGVKLNQLGTHAERDMMAALIGAVVVELPDLAGLSKGDIPTINAWITALQDELSLKWRNTQTFPRRFVLLGTSDRPTAALPPDPAGARRWLPVHLDAPWGGLSIAQSGFHVRDTLKGVREQLWAEALHWRTTARPPKHLDLHGALDRQREAHKQASPLAEILEQALDPTANYATQQKIWEAAESWVAASAHHTILPQGRRNELSDALLMLGWRRVSVRMTDGSFPKSYRRAAP